MTTRKLEEIASNLDDMSVTLEEIKEEIKGQGSAESLPKLDRVHSELERVADVIEEAVDPTLSPRR